MNARPILAILRKDLKLFFSDRKAVLITMVTPIALAAFFGFIFSGAGNYEAAKIVVRVCDEDQSPLSKAIVKSLSGDANLDVKASTVQEARGAVRSGKASVGVVLPNGFGGAAARAFFGGGAKPELSFLYDPSRSAELAMVRGILTQHAMEAVSKEVFTGSEGKVVVRESLDKLDANTSMDPRDRDALRQLLGGVDRWQGRQDERKGAAEGEGFAGGMTMPYSVKEEAVTGKVGQAYNGYAHSFAGMGVQFVLFAAIELGVGLLLERKMGLWKRLRSAPVSKHTVFAGKALSGAAIAFVTLCVTMGSGIAFFGVRPNGSWLGFGLLIVASSCMASAFGLLLAALGGSPQGTRGIAVFSVLVLCMLGGNWVPSFVFPKWLQSATLAVPTRWAMDGLDAVLWRGGGFGAALSAALVLLGFTALFGIIAALKFPWEEGQ